jgi:hypothetical protein
MHRRKWFKMSKSFQQTWVKHSEDPDGTLYYRDPETGTVYMETIQGWIEA